MKNKIQIRYIANKNGHYDIKSRAFLNEVGSYNSGYVGVTSEICRHSNKVGVEADLGIADCSRKVGLNFYIHDVSDEKAVQEMRHKLQKLKDSVALIEAHIDYAIKLQQKGVVVEDDEYNTELVFVE